MTRAEDCSLAPDTVQTGTGYELIPGERLSQTSCLRRSWGENLFAGKIFKYRDYDSYSGFSNLFRYRLLAEKGGCWVDTDVVSLKPFQFPQDYRFVSVLEGRPFFNIACIHTNKPYITFGREYYVNTWFIKAPPGSEIMDYCYRESLARDPATLKWGEIGPRLMTTAVNEFGFQQHVAPYETFFPINEHQWKQLITGSLVARWKWRKALDSSFAVHFYHEMWRRNNLDKDAAFTSNSIYEILKRRYLPD